MKGTKCAVEPPSISRSTLQINLCESTAKNVSQETYPSKTAFPKGRVELEPPRKRFQMVSAKAVAWESELNPAAPVAPPRLIVTILPFDWQV